MKLKDLYLSLIKEGKKYQINELDIRYLLSYYLKLKDSSSFFLKLEQEIKDDKLIKKGFEELCLGKPISYIINESEFLGEKYYVNEDVLIPRVETEELVMLAIRHIQQFFLNKKIKILDIGTGSGVIAIKLKKEFPNALVSATDINEKALKVAKLNAKKHQVNISFFHTDTFPNNKDKYDVIISNPPYIKFKEDVDTSVLKYEPHEALFIKSSNNVYQKVLMSNRYQNKALLIFEIAPNLVDDLKTLMGKHLSNGVFTFSKDINHKARFLSILINNDNS